MYRILSAEAENFMSYRHLSLDFRGKNFVLIQAESDNNEDSQKSNGFGKSTVAEVIAYAIYGKLLRTQGTRVNSDKLIHTGCDSMWVKVTLEEIKKADTEKPHEVVVRRTLTRSGDRTVDLWDDGVKRKFDKKTDLNKAIQEWLGLEFEMLLRRFLTPETTSFISLTPAERFKIVSAILTFNWDKVYLYAVNNSKVLKEELEGLKKDLQTLLVKEAQAEGQKDLVSHKHQMLSEKIDQLTERILGVATALDGRVAELEEIDARLAEKVGPLQTAKAERDKVNKTVTQLQDRIGTLEREKPGEQMRKHFAAIGEFSCMNCNSPVDTTALVDNLTASRRSEIAEALSDLRDALSLTSTAFAKVNGDYETLLSDYNAVSTEKNTVNSIVKGLESEVRVLTREKKTVEEQLKAATSEMTVEEADGALAKIKEDIASLNAIVTEKSELLSAYQIIKNTSQPTSSSRLSSVKKLLPALAKGVTSVATHLFGRPIRVNFEANVSDKTLEITSPDLHLEVMSTGERKSFDIAWACTVQDILLQSSRNQIGFFIGDELFDGLDLERITAAINLIRALPIPQLFVITHNEHARNIIEMTPGVSILRVNNENGVSKASFIKEAA